MVKKRAVAVAAIVAARREKSLDIKNEKQQKKR